VSQASVKNKVYVLAGYVVRVLQNGALKWKQKLTGVRSRAVTSDHTLTRGLMPQVRYRKFLEKYGSQVLPHPPYSPDMSPPAFDLFPKLKKPFSGKRFRSIEEASNEVARAIRRINNEGVLTGTQDLPKRWAAMIKHNENYIEGL
jgi:transposase